MPKYVAYVAVKHYRSFEFYADDEELAYDHIEQVIENTRTSEIMNEWEESGSEDIDVELLKEVAE